MTSSARRWWSVLAALVAVCYLVAMFVTGALPRSRQLVEFEIEGVLTTSPEAVQQVTLKAGDTEFTFTRRGQDWTGGDEAGVLEKQLGSTLERAIKFMHTSAPVRVLPANEPTTQSDAAFGLDPPRYAIVLSDSEQPLLRARFGAMNTDGFLQYMRVEGRQELYLMSRFVGAEWAAVASGMVQ